MLAGGLCALAAFRVVFAHGLDRLQDSCGCLWQVRMCMLCSASHPVRGNCLAAVLGTAVAVHVSRTVPPGQLPRPLVNRRFGGQHQQQASRLSCQAISISSSSCRTSSCSC